MNPAVLGRLGIFIMFAALHGCGGHAPPDAGGDPQRGADALRRYGCGACHRISGIAAAHGNVGPPLTNIARRVYLAGVLANTPENMIRWIRVPQEIAPRSAMPDMQVTADDARDIASYLYRH